MISIWVESLGRSYDDALDMLAAAIRDCTDDLWESGMWDVPADAFGPEPPGPDGKPVTDPAARKALVQRRSAPWSVAWHALETLDYDLTGEFSPWEPPAPFKGHPHWLLTNLPTPWTRDEMLGYLDYCRTRVHDTIADMTDEKAATLLPPAHRYSGQPHARIIMSAPGHTFEHAAQIRQFIFRERRDQKCTVLVYSFNDRSLQFHRAMGWTEEGRLRRMVYTNGEFFDEVYFGMTKEEWDVLDALPSNSPIQLPS